MKDESDKQTFKLKKNPKKKKKEKDSNSSRDSLELTIESYKNNNKITQKETEEGEKIKFFFNELPTNKNNRFATASNKKFQKLNINLQKEKEEFDFREILLNYVNQTGRTNENKSHKKERNSVIYTKPNAVLTLNGDSETNKNEFSNPISESSSEYISDSKSLSNSSTDKKTEKMEDLHKKLNENNEKNKNNIQIKNKMIHNNNKKIIPKKNNIINENNKKKEKKNIKKDEMKNKEVKKVIILSDKKVKNSEKNNESVIHSNYNKLTSSNKIKSSNTFTTGANTFNTQNTQNSSFKSLQQNIKKFNYDYLNLTDIPLQKKLIILNRINSSKMLIKEEKDKGNKNIKVKNERTNMFDKIRNINISLDVEKSYSNYFKQIINLQKQKNNYKNIPDKKEDISIRKERKSSYSNKYNKRYFYYPDEFYINRNSDLHSKSHISKLFDTLRKKC